MCTCTYALISVFEEYPVGKYTVKESAEVRFPCSLKKEFIGKGKVLWYRDIGHKHDVISYNYKTLILQAGYKIVYLRKHQGETRGTFLGFAANCGSFCNPREFCTLYLVKYNVHVELETFSEFTLMINSTNITHEGAYRCEFELYGTGSEVTTPNLLLEVLGKC